MLSIQHPTFHSRPIKSLDDFTDNHLKELANTNQPILFKSRHYSVHWNKDKTEIVSVTRDDKNSAFIDFFSRGCHFNYRATQIKEKLSLIAKKQVLLSEAKTEIQKIEQLKENVASINTSLQSHVPFIHFNKVTPGNDVVLDYWKSTASTLSFKKEEMGPFLEHSWQTIFSSISTNHQQQMDMLQRPILAELAENQRKLEELTVGLSGNVISVDLCVKLDAIKVSIANLTRRFTVAININELHKSLLERFALAIKVTQSSDLIRVLMRRMIALSEELSRQAKNITGINSASDCDRLNCYEALLKEQNLFSEQLIRQDFDTLLSPPQLHKEKTEAKKVREALYHSHAEGLIAVLGDYTATQEQVEEKMQALCEIKSIMQNYISNEKMIGVFLKTQEKSAYASKQEVNINLLKELRKTCANPSIALTRESLQAAIISANSLKEAIEVGETISCFLDSLHGERGLGRNRRSFYDEERQARINSLEEFEKICYGRQVSFKNKRETLLMVENSSDKMKVIRKVSHEHMNNIQNWRGREKKLFLGFKEAIYDRVSADTYEVMCTKPSLRRQQHFFEKTAEIHATLPEVAATLQRAKKEVVTRGEMLRKLDDKTVGLVDSSEKLKRAAKNMKKSFV